MGALESEVVGAMEKGVWKLLRREVRGREGALLGNRPWDRRKKPQAEIRGRDQGKHPLRYHLRILWAYVRRAFSPGKISLLKSLAPQKSSRTFLSHHHLSSWLWASLQLVGAMPDCSPFVTLHNQSISVYFWLHYRLYPQSGPWLSVSFAAILICHSGPK